MIVDNWIEDIKTHNFNKCVFSMEPLKYIYQLNDDLYNVVTNKDVPKTVSKLVRNTTANMVDMTSKTVISFHSMIEILKGDKKTSKLTDYPTSITDGFHKAQGSIIKRYDIIQKNVSVGSIIIEPLIGLIEGTTKILLGIHSSISSESARKRVFRYK
jgi:hypothetical protein